MGDTVAETATLPNEPVDKLTPSELNTDANSDANSVNTTVNDKSSDGDSSTPTIGSTKEDQRDTSSNSNDVDQNAYSALSDQAQKFKSKLLESEADQRNTSTSNAGESEYESANEEDIAEFENTSEPDDPNVASSKSEALSNVKSEPVADDQNNVNAKSDNFDTLNIMVENKKPQADDESESSSPNDDIKHELEEDEAEKVLNRIRRRKKRTRVSDDETIEDEDDLSPEEATAEIDEEEESFDEAEEGQLPDEADETVASLVEDERENGDGQESENQESKTKGAKVVAKKGEIEDKRNPQYIPRKGPFYEHDDRLNEADKPKESSEPVKVVEGEENDTETVKSKNRRLIASMKLRSDEMVDEEADADKLSSKSVSKEKLPDIPNIGSNVDAQEKASTGIVKSYDSKSPHEATRSRKPIWDGKDRWSHDKFNMDDQKPKSRDELIGLYGYDIRNETDAPKLQRRSYYGKGPQKYSRRPDDDSGSGFVKRSLRKVIRSPRDARPEAETKDAHPPHRENEYYEEEERVAYTQSQSKMDNFVNANNRQPPKERKVISKEPITSNARPSNYSESRYTDSVSSRVHENRVFVNKSSGLSKFGKTDKPRFGAEPQFNNKDGSSKFAQVAEGMRDNGREPEPSPAFSKDDFPELTNSAPAKVQTAPSNEPTNKNPIIYYSNTPNPSNNRNVVSRSTKDTHLHENAAFESGKESNYDFDFSRANQSVPVVKSQLYENSRFSHSRNYAPSQEYSGNNNNNNWNNSRSMGPSKNVHPVLSQAPQMKKQPHLPSSVNKEEHVAASENGEITNADSRPKRYSSIRQQRTVTVPTNPTNTTHSSQPPTYTSVSQTTVSTQQQYLTLNVDGTAANAMPTEVNPKNAYYEAATAVNSNEIAHPGNAPNMMPNTTVHHHSTHAHSYTPTMNGQSTGATAAGTAYIPAATPIMAYYDPNAAAAAGQPSGTTTATLQAPLGLTQAYFTTDQSGTAQTAPNYYLTTDLSAAVAYHPAYHLQANYQQLPTHHTHQSHVTNRYMNTTPANAPPSAESNRYLQTAPPTQNPAQILVAGQAYQAPIQTAFPSGYPPFPATQPAATPALGTSSPLPAGFPNVPIAANATSSAPVESTPQQTLASGYPELYRGGITYYDIQSQQQAMQRQIHQNMSQTRRGKGDNPDSVDGADKNSKHPAAKSEISVSN